MNSGEELNVIMARLLADLTKEGVVLGKDVAKRFFDEMYKMLTKRLELKRSTLTPGEKSLIAMRESGDNIKMVKMNRKSLEIFKEHVGKQIPYAVIRTKGQNAVRVLTKENDREIMLGIMRDTEKIKKRETLKKARNFINKGKLSFLKKIKNAITKVNITVRKKINSLEGKLNEDVGPNNKHSIDKANPEETVENSLVKDKDNHDKQHTVENIQTKNELKDENFVGDKNDTKLTEREDIDDLNKSLIFQERMKKSLITQQEENSKSAANTYIKNTRSNRNKSGGISK